MKPYSIKISDQVLLKHRPSKSRTQYNPGPFEVIDVRGNHIISESDGQKVLAKSLPRMLRSEGIFKVEPNLAIPVNSFLEKEKRMMYTQLMETQMLLYISKKYTLRAAITHSPQSHILLKRLHLSTFGVRPEKDDAQLGSKIINWNLINKFSLHSFEMVSGFQFCVWQMLRLIYCHDYCKVSRRRDTDFMCVHT